MLCLGIDTSGETLSVGICKEGEVFGDRVEQCGQPHSTVLIDEIEALLAEVNVQLDQVELIAVSAGPGRYTALRVGMATAKGIAVSMGIPLTRVSSLEALAAGVLPWEGPLCVVMDARKRLVYVGWFKGKGKKLIRMEEDQALSYDVAAALIPKGAGVVGDGTPLIQPELERRRVTVKVITGLIHGGDVACLGEKAYRKRGQNELYEGPVYIRQIEIYNPTIERR